MDLFQWLTDTTEGKCLFTTLVSMIPIIELRAVSYTHLDVYKRQYLLRPGRWRAEGTYYDETGCSFPLAGETELVQEGAERHLDGWMEVSGPAPVRFTNRYVIRETDRPFTLTWQSFNPVPVSYTHLDVYKRQGRCPCLGWSRLTGPGGGDGRTGLPA